MTHRALPLLAALLFPLLPCAARAGAVTAESIWDQDHARQAAMERVPADARVTETRCQEIGRGRASFFYRCTVFFTQGPTPGAGSGAQPDPADARP